MERFVVQLNHPKVRTEQFFGRTFRVIPAVLVRSQVLRNNLGDTLLPANAITDEWAAQWNNIPVIVGPHPQNRGQLVSGRTPELLNERGVGWIYHARAEQESDDVRRLVGEVWIDEGRIGAVAGLQEALDQVAAGQPVELSTGFSAQVEKRSGEFRGERYEAVLYPGVADHLIISTELTGACAVADGCGLGANARESIIMTTGTSGAKSTIKSIWEKVGAVLTRREETKVAQTAWDDMVANRIALEMEILNAVSPSDQERARMLEGALQSKFGGSDRHVVLLDTYADQKQVVFYLSTPLGPQPPGTEYFRCSFTEEQGGAFTFGEPEKVRRMTSYEPAAANAAVHNSTGTPGCGCRKEEVTMQENEKKELVQELTAAFTALLKPVTDKVDAVANTAKETAESVVNGAIGEFKTALTALTAKVDAAVAAVNAERDRERQELVTQLAANDKSGFTAAELEAMPLEQIRKIAALAKIEVANYAARGGPRAHAGGQSEPEYVEPVPYFQKEQSNASGQNKAGE